MPQQSHLFIGGQAGRCQVVGFCSVFQVAGNKGRRETVKIPAVMPSLNTCVNERYRDPVVSEIHVRQRCVCLDCLVSETSVYALPIFQQLVIGRRFQYTAGIFRLIFNADFPHRRHPVVHNPVRRPQLFLWLTIPRPMAFSLNHFSPAHFVFACNAAHGSRWNWSRNATTNFKARSKLIAARNATPLSISPNIIRHMRSSKPTLMAELLGGAPVA